MPSQPFTLVFADPLNEADRSLVEAEAAHRGITVRIATDDAPFGDLLPSANALVIQRADLTAEQISAAPGLRLILVPEVARGQIDRAAAAARGITLVDLRNLGLLGVAEHTMMLLLALVKELPATHARTAAGERAPGVSEIRTTAREIGYNWLGQHDLGWLYRKRLGIVGLGRIGRAVAERASAFGMKLFYAAPRRLDAAEERRLGATHLSLDDLLRQSDFVSLHVRLTPETERMIGEAELAKMRSTAYFVNTARGGLVDEAALIDALSERRIHAAGLDVFEYEPLRRDSPLLRLDNVILTPHIAGTYDPDARREQLLEAFDHVADQMKEGNG